MRRLEQYFEKKEVLRNVRSPTVTCIPLRPRDRTTANVFLKCPSVTRTVDIVSSEFRVQSSEFGVQSSEFREKKLKRNTPDYALITPNWFQISPSSARLGKF